MMTSNDSKREQFQEKLEKLYESSSTDNLSKLRRFGWERFTEMGLPTKKQEVYQYIKLRNLFGKELAFPTSHSLSKEVIQKHLYKECQNAYLTFVNGEYLEELSDRTGISDKVVIADMTEAARTYGAFLNNHLTKVMKEESDPFAAINIALHKKGLFLYIPPTTTVEEPIQILNFVTEESENALLSPRLQLFAGKSSIINLYASTVHLGGSNTSINQLSDFSLDENANVTFTQISLDHGSSTWHFDAVRATLKRNSRFKSVAVTEGAATYRNDYHVTMTQEGAEAELDGVWMLKDKLESHTNILIDHKAPHCNSRQMFKGVLRDVAKSSFEGKILVRQAAQKTDAFQLNNNLLLDPHAHADSKPNLEIFADDVIASHGATVGRLDEEQMFYIKSRGFSDEEAKNLLIYGYCKEVIERISLPSLFETLKERTENYMR